MEDSSRRASGSNSLGLELRAINIKGRITIFQALEFIGLHLLHGHSTQQIVCPFHDDTKPSARAYQDSNKFFCFTCHKTWDVITVVMDGKEKSFPDAIETIETHFKLASPLENLPLTIRYNVEKQQKPTQSLHYLQTYVEACLIDARQRLGLQRYCKLLTALDITTFNFQTKRVPEEAYKDILRKILLKIPPDV